MKKKLIKTALVASCAVAPLTVQSSKIDFKDMELRCLKANIFFEARGESFKGKAAVAQVTTNRVLNPNYPNTICGTVFQKRQFSWTHQLSWKSIQRILNGDIKHLKEKDKQAYYDALILAEKGVEYKLAVLPKTVLHYHATYVDPSWAGKMKRHTKIGKHVFYDNKKES